MRAPSLVVLVNTRVEELLKGGSLRIGSEWARTEGQALLQMIRNGSLARKDEGGAGQ